MSLERTKFDATPEHRAAYLKAAIEANDATRLVKAIGDVVRTIGVRAFAEQTGLSRSAVYKAFIYEGGNPTIETLFKAFDVIGVQLTVKAACFNDAAHALVDQSGQGSA